jgi:hypothetical protein
MLLGCAIDDRDITGGYDNLDEQFQFTKIDRLLEYDMTVDFSNKTSRLVEYSSLLIKPHCEDGAPLLTRSFDYLLSNSPRVKTTFHRRIFPPRVAEPADPDAKAALRSRSSVRTLCVVIGDSSRTRLDWPGRLFRIRV